ncbi:MAG: hypothetical protein JXB30_11220 [Anaerolineae bacterium]|nr:hypothetical protein [Anaerolineae bacterium]
MAGYIFSLDNLDSLRLYTMNGVYATKLSKPPHAWRTHHEGTFADYATMKEGDSIYFFIQRKIYGIGKLIDVEQDCKFFNYPYAGTPDRFSYSDIQPYLLWDEGDISVDQRCLCVFEPDPHFFTMGIDMDDVLSSNPAAFKMLRAFWKLSFIKFDDEENQAFRDILLKRNQSALFHPEGADIFDFQPAHHQIAERQLTGDYRMSSGISMVLSSCVDEGRLKHEMVLEAGILHQLAVRYPATCAVLGEWDYLSHQVIASPFKPIDYMDKMDLFGYSYIPDFKPTKARYLVGEIKRDGAGLEDIDQLLKYVDWVKDEYCFGDYSMIDAFLIAYEFDEHVIEHAKTVGIRRYTIGMRPAQSLEWSNLKLVKYWFDPSAERLEFTSVD